MSQMSEIVALEAKSWSLGLWKPRTRNDLTVALEAF